MIYHLPHNETRSIIQVGLAAMQAGDRIEFCLSKLYIKLYYKVQRHGGIRNLEGETGNSNERIGQE